MIRVVVVDDHPVVRAGLVAVLTDEPDFDVVGQAASAEAGITLVDRHRPNVALLDLELPGMSGAEAIPRIMRVSPETRVIVFTAYESDERIFGAIRAGAKGYLLKGAPAAEIGRAVRDVAAGGSYLEPRIAARVIAQISDPRPAAGTLTERERQVLRLVADGLSNKAIARTLAVTERTAKFHVASLSSKLGAGNRTQAVAIAVQRGLL